MSGALSAWHHRRAQDCQVQIWSPAEPLLPQSLLRMPFRPVEGEGGGVWPPSPTPMMGHGAPPG